MANVWIWQFQPEPNDRNGAEWIHRLDADLTAAFHALCFQSRRSAFGQIKAGQRPFQILLATVVVFESSHLLAADITVGSVLDFSGIGLTPIVNASSGFQSAIRESG